MEHIYEVEVDDPDKGLDTLEHIKQPLAAMIGCLVAFAERGVSRDEMNLALQDFMLHVSVGLQMRCPECRASIKELVPPDCPTCEGRGWVWKPDPNPPSN